MYVTYDGNVDKTMEYAMNDICYVFFFKVIDICYICMIMLCLIIEVFYD